MSAWKKFLYLNVGAIVGIIASLFILPGNLRLAYWLCGAIVVLATVNVLAIWIMRSAKRSDDATRRLKTSSKVIIYAGLLFFLLDMVLSYIFRR